MYSVNKGADRQCCHRTADLHLCFRTHLKQVFSWCDSFSTIPTLLGPIILSVMNLRLRMLLLFFFWLFIYLFIYSFYLFMPPTLKKWGGILVSACPYVCMYVRTYVCMYVFMFEISS